MKPPVVADLVWTGDLRFSATSAASSGITGITIDGNSTAGPSPVQTLVFALAGCMAADVVHILTKGHHRLRALKAHLSGERAQEDPHRLIRVDLRFDIEGAVPQDAADRAVAMSREKYCSVWHSLNPAIDFHVTCDVHADA
jgi:putative redox protein